MAASQQWRWCGFVASRDGGPPSVFLQGCEIDALTPREAFWRLRALWRGLSTSDPDPAVTAVAASNASCVTGTQIWSTQTRAP
eukprot:1637482-Prymnesium_polylepis.1